MPLDTVHRNERLGLAKVSLMRGKKRLLTAGKGPPVLWDSGLGATARHSGSTMRAQQEHDGNTTAPPAQSSPLSSVRSAMCIVNALGKDQAPLGAACRVPAADRSHMPLLAELEPSLMVRGSIGMSLLTELSFVF